MKVIIVDDEPMARMALRNILKTHFPQVEVLAECKNVPEAVKQINDLRPQVVFLDIEMPEYTGFDLLNFFRPEHIDFEIVFITAYNEYALRAFEISAVDYLLKPLQVEHLERAIKRLKAQPDTRKYEVLKENVNSAEEKKIVLQNTESAFVIQISDIVFLEAQGSYTNVVSHSHPDILISKKISHFDFLEQLPSFFRSHRSYLINLQHVKRINKKDFTIEMDNQRSAYLAQDRKNTLLEALGKS